MTVQHTNFLCAARDSELSQSLHVKASSPLHSSVSYPNFHSLQLPSHLSNSSAKMSSSIITTEGTLTTPDGLDLYTRTWHPPTSISPPKARCVFLHGFSDHCNFYGVLFPSLAKQGIKVYSFDQRGWGRSVHTRAQRGLTGSSKQVMEDVTFFIKSLPVEEAAVPLFLMGHSMGGGEVLYYISTGPEEVKKSIRGYLCEAPFVSLHESSKPWKGTVVLGRLAGKIMPHRQMVQQLDPKKICRDADVCKEFVEDELCHDTGTLEGLAGMLDRASELEEGKVVVKEGQGEGGKTRLWVGFGTGDEILSEDVCRRWFEKTRIEDKQYRKYEGWFHKLHAEVSLITDHFRCLQSSSQADILGSRTTTNFNSPKTLPNGYSIAAVHLKVWRARQQNPNCSRCSVVRVSITAANGSNRLLSFVNSIAFQERLRQALLAICCTVPSRHVAVTPQNKPRYAMPLLPASRLISTSKKSSRSARWGTRS